MIAYVAYVGTIAAFVLIGLALDAYFTRRDNR